MLQSIIVGVCHVSAQCTDANACTFPVFYLCCMRHVLQKMRIERMPSVAAAGAGANAHAFVSFISDVCAMEHAAANVNSAHTTRHTAAGVGAGVSSDARGYILSKHHSCGCPLWNATCYPFLPT